MPSDERHFQRRGYVTQRGPERQERPLHRDELTYGGTTCKWQFKENIIPSQHICRNYPHFWKSG